MAIFSPWKSHVAFREYVADVETNITCPTLKKDVPRKKTVLTAKAPIRPGTKLDQFFKTRKCMLKQRLTENAASKLLRGLSMEVVTQESTRIKATRCETLRTVITNNSKKHLHLTYCLKSERLQFFPLLNPFY